MSGEVSSRRAAVRSALAFPAGPGRLVLGGRFGEQRDAPSVRLLDDFTDAGGRLVETAAAYADGAGERTMGAWLGEASAEVVCVTKVGHPPPGRADVEIDRIPAELAGSRHRLGRDVLDLVLLHRDDPRAPVDMLLAPLLEAARAGVVAAVGVANWQAPRLEEALTVSAAAGVPLAAASAHVSLATCTRPLWPGVVAAGPTLLDVHRAHRLPLLAWSANARGWFAGLLLDPATADIDAKRTFDNPANRRRLQRCRELADASGTTPAVIALAWTLHRYPFVTAVIGPSTVGELREALLATTLPLSADDIATLDAL